MSEKGGKGLKSSFKSKDGGKDGNSTRLRKGIHFHSQETSEPNYKVLNGSDQQFQSFSAQGGKRDKASKSGKSSILSFDVKDLPENGECMMDCEAFEILDGIKGYLVGLSEDPSIKIPVLVSLNTTFLHAERVSGFSNMFEVSRSYDKALSYLESCTHYSNPQSVRQVLGPLKTHGISDGEIFVIANTGPESIDEVFAFIPTLKAKKEVINQPLQDAVEKLSKLKRSG